MAGIKDVPLVGKVLLIIAVFGAFSIGSSVYSTSAMRHIDQSYAAALDHEAIGATYLTRASSLLNQAVTAIADLEISITDEGNRAAFADFKAARDAMAEDFVKVKAVLPNYTEAIDDLTRRSTTALDRTCAKAMSMGAAATSEQAALAAQAEYMASCKPVIGPIVKDLKALTDRSLRDAVMVHDAMSAMTNQTVTATYAAMLGGVALVVLLAYAAINAWISRPIKSIVEVMSAIARGDLSVTVVGTGRKDELGPMAQAVQIFKDNGLKLAASEMEAARQRQQADHERAVNDAARAEVKRQQDLVVTAIAEGLARLSKGDLTGRLSQAFAAEYEKLRVDFNATADSLHEALSTISTAANGIRSGSDQIAFASDDLSRRTEQQAANLEETAAALNIITDTVKTMAGNAGDAATVVVTTRAAAEASGSIVQRAVEAMDKIKESSNKISNIIGVIDEIAFQTNLLALNAGVEAARAGDAGRGFAVVASEVRALAQRSAEAAKEIKGLISASTVQVESGVVLVDRTGLALKDIIVKVAEIDTLVRRISAASQEQATGIAEINTAVSQMDQVVQQNAAMVEESTAAAHALKNETLDLSTMVGRFDIGESRRAVSRDGSRGNPAAANAAKLRAPAVSHVSAARPKLKGSVATAEASHDRDWEEF